MEETSQVIKYLEFSDLIEIHRRHLSSEGIETSFAGVLHNPNSLGYLLDVVTIGQSQSDPYPTLAEKAAVYAFNIITRHVFVDGNKRTGMTAMFWFLNLNGADLRDITSKEIVNVALSIAENKMAFDELIQWIDQRIIFTDKFK
ncbi:MAG: type II toxin-antitoxin system death-on-curing family toxin [Desulfomonilaceae bacterium]